MTRMATQAEQADHNRDNRKHSMTNREIIAELARLEREILDTIARSQAATKQAMHTIDGLMDQLGIPKAKTDAS